MLFTDIEGSTQMLRRLGRERYVAALTSHRRLIRESLRRYGGVEVEMQGDSFHFAFSYARDAAVAAAEAQRALAEFEWPDEPIRVRIGLHTGEPTIQDDLYAGLDVHRAARVMAAAHGGQVLLSSRTADLVEGELPPGVWMRPLGRYSLKDFERPEALSQLAIEGIDTEFPPLRVPPAAPGGLRRLGTRRRVLAAAGVLALTATGAAVAAVLAFSGGSGVKGPTGDVVVSIDPARNAVVGRTAVGGVPGRVAAGEGAIWVMNRADSTITKLDPASGAAVRTTSAQGTPADLTTGAGAVWVVNVPPADRPGVQQAATVSKLDPVTVSPLSSVRIAAPPTYFRAIGSLCYSRGALWATIQRRLARIDPDSGRARVTALSATASGPIAVGGGFVWVAGQDGLSRIDPATGKVTGTVGIQTFEDGGLVFLDRWLWVINTRADAVAQIDPLTDTVVRTVSVGRNPTSIAAGYGSLWVSSQDGTVARIDPDGARVVDTVDVGGTPEDVAIGFGRVWVASA